MLGKVIIYLSAFFWLLSFLFNLFNSRKEDEKLKKLAKYSYFGGILCVLLAAIYLLFNIFSHNFQLSYVWSYSSRKLPFFLLLSSFYAGQEGSFLLWALWLSIIGVFFYYFVHKNNINYLNLSTYSLVIFILVLILIFKSPFANLWETFPEGNIPKDFVPPDGRGLNPILENYWNAIHPPVLFLGYSLLTVPFVLAVSHWIKREYYNWVNYSTIWAFLGAGILGLGIMFGGFWSYETLGWGGYWGWDPVENSSLVPWLLITTFAHTIILQRSNKGLIKTNYILATTSFLTVLYATYLARSGVLSDTSVHSFVDPGKIVNSLLIIFLLITFLISTIVFFIHLKDTKIPKSNFKYLSREFFLVLGSLILIIVSIVIILGTSLPIFQGWLGTKKVALDPSFYNQWMLPLAILIMLLNTVSIMFTWKDSKLNSVVKKYRFDFLVSLFLGILFLLLVQLNLAYGIIIFSSVFSIMVNARKILQKFKRKNLRIGAFISHLGIALIIIGSLTSGGFQETKVIHLTEGKSANAFGYDFEFLNREQIEKHLSDREKYLYHIKISNDNYSSIVKPVVYWSEFNDFQQPYFEPDIKTFILKDIYISPKSLSFTELFKPLTLKKGQKISSPWHKNDSITFSGYDMSSMNVKGNTDHFLFGIILRYEIEKKEFIDTIYSILNMKMNSFSPVWQRVPNKDFSIGFTEFQPSEILSESSIVLSFGQEFFIADITVKPLISLVWLGVILIVLGFFFAISKYSKFNANVQGNYLKT